MIELTSKVHAGNILGFLEEVTGRLKDDDFNIAEEIVIMYIKNHLSDSENVSGIQLESFGNWCIRVKESSPNAPWEDETVESMYKTYRLEKTGL